MLLVKDLKNKLNIAKLLIPSNMSLQNYPEGSWERTYLVNKDEIDAALIMNSGNIVFDFIAEAENYTQAQYNATINAFLIATEYQLLKLWDTTKLEYHPLDNYREHMKKTIKGAIDHDMIGDMHVQNSGAITNVRNGNETFEQAGTETDVLHPLHSRETIEYKSPYNAPLEDTTQEAVFYPESKREEVVPSGSDETTDHHFIGRTDTTTYNDVTDTNTDTRETTTSFNNRKNRDSWDNYEEEVTEDGCSRGDTSQHLLEEERRISDWSFWYSLFGLYVRYVTTGLYDFDCNF